jgi:hypothetical protein
MPALSEQLGNKVLVTSFHGRLEAVCSAPIIDTHTHTHTHTNTHTLSGKCMCTL